MNKKFKQEPGDILNNQDIWYRNPMVLLAIGLPAVVVIASILTIVIAFSNAPILTSSINSGHCSFVSKTIG